MIFGMNAMWLIVLMLIPRLLGKKLAWMVSIPNKDYWMATDERREECGKLMNTMILGIAFLTNLMCSVVYHAVIQSNIETRLRINIWAIWITTGIMLIFTFVYLLTAFKKPSDAGSQVQ
jgi:hypothetical protein